jgi:hypothetical protein
MSRYIRIQQKTISRTEPLISNDIDVVKQACNELKIDFDTLEFKAFKRILYVVNKITVDVYEDSCSKKIKTKEYLAKTNQTKELNLKISQIANIPYKPALIKSETPMMLSTIEDKKAYYIEMAKAKGYHVEEKNENGKVRIKLVKS